MCHLYLPRNSVVLSASTILYIYDNMFTESEFDLHQDAKKHTVSKSEAHR